MLLRRTNFSTPQQLEVVGGAGAAGVVVVAGAAEGGGEGVAGAEGQQLPMSRMKTMIKRVMGSPSLMQAKMLWR
jgi:hypothetical protein